MATNAENIDTAIAAICTALAAGAGKPNYTIDGQTVSYDTLTTRLRDLQQLKAEMAGPYELETQAYT